MLETLPLLLLTTVLDPGVKRFTSRHIEMIMHTKDDDSMDLVVFVDNNLSFIMLLKRYKVPIV